MYATNGNAERARWQVLWIGKGKVQSKDFDHDLAGALELYEKVKAAGRSGATLRCCNMGFPPPVKYADREEVIVLRGGRKFKGQQIIVPHVYRERMHGVNVKGAWWCPYCIKLRRFKRREGFELEGIWIDEPAMVCPMCNISHRDASVSKYNPLAARYGDMRRTRSDKGVARG